MATTTPVNVFPEGVKPFAERKLPKTICMFDVDGTLSLARLAAKPEMHAALKKLRTITAVAVVGGSDMKKIREQLEIPGEECALGGVEDVRGALIAVTNKVDYAFGENGLVAYKLGNELKSNSFIQHVGEDEYKKIVNWTLRYLSEVDIPIKRWASSRDIEYLS